MEQELLDKLEAMELGDRQPRVEKGLLDLPVNLMYEVFGPLDARSLLEAANSHRTLRKHVALWPGKKWDVVLCSGRTILIDNDIFQSQGAGVLLQNAVYNQENRSAVTETSTNICDLPYDLLWPIMEPLKVEDLLSVAKCHPNLQRATRKMMDKCIQGMECFPQQVVFHTKHCYRAGALTCSESAILVTDAHFESVIYELRIDFPSVMRVDRLILKGGQHYAHKCAGLIEKWKPKEVAFPRWSAEAFNSIPELPRLLKDVERLQLGVLTAEWLSYIPEWQFTDLTFCLSTGCEDVTPQIQRMCEELFDQWVAGERSTFFVEFGVDRGCRWFALGGLSSEAEPTYEVEREDGSILMLHNSSWGITMSTSGSTNGLNVNYPPKWSDF